HGPQRVVKQHGEAVVIIPAEEFDRTSARGQQPDSATPAEPSNGSARRSARHLSVITVGGRHCRAGSIATCVYALRGASCRWTKAWPSVGGRSRRLPNGSASRCPRSTPSLRPPPCIMA